ncbi:MAG: GGDEF domain-containing protein [Pseudomonadota bacterium]|nr:GGDEF domain-containing protein [Pseudomonadota bacterium]
MKADALKEKAQPEAAEKPLRVSPKMAERLSMLGIPEEEMTPAVSLAVSALMEKLDDVNRDLSRTKESLAELERLVDVDCVAPIPNRRAFMRRLAWAITMHERYGHPSTILYFDLNDFKQINDQYGHAAGDLAIRHISQLLSSAMRESDFLARIGGDEFAVIMYYAGEEAARKRGAKIAEKLQKTPFVFNGKHLHVTAAYGYYSIKSGDDAEAALASADMSMYVHKRRDKATQTA